MSKFKEVPSDEEIAADARAEEREARQLAIAEEVEERVNEIRTDGDIVQRARKLFSNGSINFPDVKKVRQGDMFITQPLMTDQNKMAILSAMFDEDGDAMPHRDHFKGRIVDHEGRVIDDHYPVVRWIEAFAAGGLKGVSAKGAREVVREFALEHERNDLINFVEGRIPEWDGKERIRSKLVDMFECKDTELNRDFSEYFWLSIYTRVMMPGSLAPIVLSLFGAQGCGKSLFTKRICQIVTGNPDADSVQLNLDGDKLDFLRNITGTSIIASIGEMTGFARGDLNKIKDFITRDTDQLHYKFEGTFTQSRQWITVMDGNKYEGTQRDETGNRRFYPMFCGQLTDRLGKPQWRSDFTVDQSHWETFEDEVWQMMAECAAWLEERGVKAYEKFVRGLITKVAEFSMNEMARDSGTIQDDVLEVYLVPMLKEGPKFMWTTRAGVVGVGIQNGDFKRHFMDENKHVKANWRHLKNKMTALGGQEFSFNGGYAGYFFPGYNSLEDFESRIGVATDFEADGKAGTAIVPQEKF